MLVERRRRVRAGFARNIGRALSAAVFYSNEANNMHRFVPIDAGPASCAPAAHRGRPTVLPGSHGTLAIVDV
ncbi:hypothetical protein [Burkholderia pseudomultivorans]|uniref:hypothetical protein n=1 Tax=Burkholderia pseudomultivorans TaxID=1207504 RepID=UPI000A80D9D1|nr:hypothetical protein [Burkholderia pseudomultivorans]